MKDERWRRADGQRPLVLGHRGARHAAPENTFEAFELAIHEGAEGVELDVRLSADRHVIVFHDRTLARLTGWHDVRDVEAVPGAELERLGVPRLADVLDWAARGGHRVNVELKRDVSNRAELVQKTLAIVGALPEPEAVVLFSSFDPAIVRALSLGLARVPVGWLVHAGQRVLRRAPGFRLLGARAVHPENVLCTPSEVARHRRAGAIVNVWTVNDPARARELADLGVDAIISDVPGRILEAL